MLSKVTHGLNHYDFDDVARELHEFTWDYFCDWYIEIAKTQLANEETKDQTKRVLHTIFEGLMRALHPIMPFITEELWAKLPKSELYSHLISVMFAPYPRPDDRFLNETAEEQMSLVMKDIRAIRDMRATFSVPAKAEVEVIVATTDSAETELLKSTQQYIQKLAQCTMSFTTDMAAPARAARQSVSNSTLYVPLANVIDVDKAKVKLQQRRTAIEKDIAKVESQLNNPDFRTRAPQDKVLNMVAQLSDLKNQLISTDAQLKILAS
jgi:valyl-tRNA synthetase